ncbi:MAG: hypothetical protein SLAVMIC_00907 [uncultured marine phage]|uniref:Uncharacterized protein n=1 Tax=uncultured marine phage TaxID=707152 RepID=A0A8D9CDU9_9VIRU|nr:MAG: hypothetical protein SLAVMIC_00907 [uncultured marine phage]
MRTIHKFNQFFESKEPENSKDETQETLSDDVLEVEVDGEEVDMKDYYIEDVLDVIIPDEKEFGNSVEENLNAIGVHSDLTVRQAKRGDIIWITALLRKKGTSSFTSPAVQGVLKVRIVDIYYGLQYLNKVINK